MLLANLRDEIPPQLPVAAAERQAKPTMDAEKNVKASSHKDIQPLPPHQVLLTSEHRSSPKVKEYWSWGLGVLVKTGTNTVITGISDLGHSSARTDLRIGDEIIRIGRENLSAENAFNVLTKPLPKEAGGLLPILVRRDGQDLTIRFKPNEF